MRELLHLEQRANVRVIIIDSHRCGRLESQCLFVLGIACLAVCTAVLPQCATSADAGSVCTYPPPSSFLRLSCRDRSALRICAVLSVVFP